jgi:PTH2 family peptidyl-tRNA hydrolase
MMNTKQVIVWRKDLRTTEGHKVRSGKMAAQIAHASMKAILDLGCFHDRDTQAHDPFVIPMDEVLEDWIGGLFTKVCVSVNSEQELLDIYEQAKEANLICSLIQDAGLTEFGGVPTYTAVAVGPGHAEDINKITGGLKLL